MSDDLTRLTDEERDSLLAWVSFDTDEGEAGFLEEVESLLAARTAALIDRAERAERERDKLRDSIRQLHQASPGILWSGLICVACSDEDCEVMYPCRSVALLTDEGDNG